jgi:hypothetical protein
VNAIWLAETNQSMRSSLTEVVDMAGDPPRLAFIPEVWRAVTDPESTRRAIVRAERVLTELRASWTVTDDPIGWWHEGWVHDTVTRAAENLDRALDRWRDLYLVTRAEYIEQGKLAVAHGASRREQEAAAMREREARDRLRLLSNDNSSNMENDFYSYRYLATEGFLPGYSFPRLPLAAYVPGSRTTQRKGEGSYLQRPRFVAIREFGPGALIYHEGSRYEVVRVQLPRSTDGAGGVDTEDAIRCDACGYHHPVTAGIDMCEHCGTRLGAKTYGLLRLQTVHTRKRQRISSDEEERRRSGFEIETSYRFAMHGDRPGVINASTNLDDAAVADLEYGDAATVRLANVGRWRRKDSADRGFWLDPVEGKWLSDKAASDATIDTDDLEPMDGAKSKKKVIPYVQDTRNVLVLRHADRLDLVASTSLRYALERGMEATFQLEDSELESAALPDVDLRGRMLFTESAEGGAGVLRRLVSEPKLLAEVAQVALELLHFDPQTGEDRGQADDATERCERGCYDCLLSFSNQGEHSMIDRQEAKELLIALSHSKTEAGGGGRNRTSTIADLKSLCDSTLEEEFIDWLDGKGLRLPDRAQVTVAHASAKPDFVYDLPSGRVAIFIDGPVHDSPHTVERDAAASERLVNAGWDVVRFAYNEDWATKAATRPGVFGTPAGGQT